ncbi:MAG: alpha/beta hydrolase [Microbacterium sp.]
MSAALDRLVPLPRPAVSERVPVLRAPDASLTRPATPGWQVEERGAAEARVRFWHHAPLARAVALAASGWGRPDPPDACDLVAAGDGWWTGAFRVPSDWQATYAMVEHDGAGDPPWWEDGLKARPRLVLGTTDMRRAHQGAAVRLVGGRPWLRTDGSVPVRLDELPRRAGEPRVRVARTGGDTGEVPLVVVFDGEAHVERLGTPALYEAAHRSGIAPSLALAFVDSGPDRGSALGVPGAHARWVARELVPRLQREGVRGPVSAERTIVQGSSFGGLSALFALSRSEGRIASAVAQSVSFWRYPRGELLEAVADALPRRSRVRLHAGRYEGRGPEVSRDLAGLLTARGHDAGARVVSGGHDWAWWVPEAIEEVGALLRG